MNQPANRQHLLAWHFALFGALFCTIFALNAGAAERAPDPEPAKLFKQRFDEDKIKGTGHFFALVVKCDARRLKELSDRLEDGATSVVEYDFVFESVPRNPKKNRVIGGQLDAAVAACIAKKYNQEYTPIVLPITPPSIPEDIRFPVVLKKGQAPLFPRTPVFSVSEENSPE